EGNAVSLPIQASDLDGDTLSYQAIGLPADLAINAQTGLISGTLAPNSGGNNLVILQVSDGSNVVTLPFDWWVVDATVPLVMTPANQVKAEGETVTLPVPASDPDQDPLRYQATDLPAGLTIDPVTGAISGIIDYSAAEINGGIYTVQLFVSDGLNTGASGTFT